MNDVVLAFVLTSPAWLLALLVLPSTLKEIWGDDSHPTQG